MEKCVVEEWIQKRSQPVAQPSPIASSEGFSKATRDPNPQSLHTVAQVELFPKIDHYMCPLPPRVIMDVEKGSNSPEPGEVYQHLPMDDKLKRYLRNTRNVEGLNLDQTAALFLVGYVLEEPVIVLLNKKYLTPNMYGPLSNEEMAKYKVIQCRDTRARTLSVEIYRKHLLDVNIGDTIQIYPEPKRSSWHAGNYGILRYKGPFFDRELPPQSELSDFAKGRNMWIGVELSGKYAGTGHSDGTFDGRRYFSCRENCALFVPYYDFNFSLEDTAKYVRRKCENVSQPHDPLDAIVARLKKQLGKSDQRNPVTVQEMENSLNRAFPFQLSCTVELAVVRQAFVNDYGDKKHLQHVEKLKKLPGVADVFCVEQDGASWFIVVAEPRMRRAVQESIVLIQELFKLPSQLRGAFSNLNCASLKTIREVSGCAVRLSDDKLDLLLTGLQSEVHAARLLLEEEVSGLAPANKAAKVMPKKKKPAPVLPEVGKAAVGTSTAGNSNITALVEEVAPIPNPCADLDKEVEKITERMNTMGSDAHTRVLSPVVVSEQRGLDCVVCLALPANTAFHPCGHKHTCQDCANKLFNSKKPNCPTCRSKINLLLRIYE